MYSRDYLMRLIQSMTTAVGQLMGLRQQKKLDEALALVDEWLIRQLRLRVRLALGLSDKDLLGMLSAGGVPNGESVAAVAAMLRQAGDIHAAQGNAEESVPCYAKALRLNVCVLRECGELQGWSVTEQIDPLLEALAPYEWDDDTKRAAMWWYEENGRYAEAENVLFELQESGAAAPEEGAAFYDRLAAVDEERLISGGLTREEAEEGRRQWARLAGETA